MTTLIAFIIINVIAWCFVIWRAQSDDHAGKQTTDAPVGRWNQIGSKH